MEVLPPYQSYWDFLPAEIQEEIVWLAKWNNYEAVREKVASRGDVRMWIKKGRNIKF